MTQPRDPRPTCPPEPLEITEEEYEAVFQRFIESRDDFIKFGLMVLESPNIDRTEEATAALKKWAQAQAEWADAQRRAASDHQTRMHDEPAYRRKVRERDYLP